MFGPGERLDRVEVLARAASARRDPGLEIRFERLADLAQLPSPAATRGRVVLDAERLPLEDLGFLRRFLAGSPGWSLLLVGDDAGHRAARTALGLARTRWMQWPPDLAQLDEIVGAPEDLRPRQAAAASGSAPAAAALAELAAPLAELSALAERVQAAAGAEPEGSAEPARLARLARALLHRVAPPPPSATALDLGALLEDLLAGLTLRGKKAPRFLYRGARGVEVYAAREALATALESLLLLARGCAGPGDMVRVQLGARPGVPGQARFQVDFPSGPLTGADPAALLAGVGLESLTEVGALELAAARAVLDALTGHVDLAFPEEGAAQLSVDLPAELQPQEAPDEPAAAPEPAST